MATRNREHGVELIRRFGGRVASPRVAFAPSGGAARGERGKMRHSRCVLTRAVGRNFATPLPRRLRPRRGNQGKIRHSRRTLYINTVISACRQELLTVRCRFRFASRFPDSATLRNDSAIQLTAQLCRALEDSLSNGDDFHFDELD